MIKHPKRPLSETQLSRLFDATSKQFHQNFNKIDDTYVLIKSRKGSFYIDREDVVDVRWKKKENVPFPKYYLSKSNKFFPTVIIDDIYYHPDSPLIIITTDTKRHILREKGIQTIRGYYEHSLGLFYDRQSDEFYPKTDAVWAEDVDTVVQRGHTGTYGGKVYKYPEFSTSPSNWSHAPYINETIFPEINERRIGIEYEFGKSFAMFRDFIKSDFKDEWFSTRDGSLDNISQGIEFVSIPFKIEELHKAIEFLNFCQERGAVIYDQCGFHVHIGASDLNFVDISSLITLCFKLEKDMFRLGGAHRSSNTFCRSLDERFTGFTTVTLPKDKNSVGNKLYDGHSADFGRRHTQSKYVDAGGHRGVRYYWMNIDRFFHKRETPEQKTVEFRNHIATFNGADFYNYTLLCYYIVEFAKTHSKDTCKTTTIYDVVDSSHIRHRKQLKQYIKSKLG